MTCSVDGCDKPVQARELCAAHYKRLRVHGSPTAPMLPHANSIKTHCPRGHELTASNLYRRSDRPGRMCRECKRIRQRDARQRERQVERDAWMALNAGEQTGHARERTTHA